MTLAEFFAGHPRAAVALSGGVDSSVVAGLSAKASGRQLTCVFVNHGLLRKNEPEEVEEVFTKQFAVVGCKQDDRIV